MNGKQSKCGLCSRYFADCDLRLNQVSIGGRTGDLLCQQCWSVICPQPWPSSSHSKSDSPGDQMTTGRPPLNRRSSTPCVPVNGLNIHQKPYCRRTQSMAEIPLGIAMPSPRPLQYNSWHSASLPEQHVILSGPSSNDPRWGALAQTCSAGGSFTDPRTKPLGATAPTLTRPLGQSLHAAPASAPTFSPFELRNLMDEESLELFESQSHLLDDNSKAALMKQRQYLQWQHRQNSLTEAGPMESVLERQDSAGSGSAAGALLTNTEDPKSNEIGSDGPAYANSLVKRIEQLEGQLAVMQGRAQGLDSKLKEYMELAHCRICRTALRNCVALPCLHFHFCDTCFKQHCLQTQNCPTCSMTVTGYQALLISR